MDNSKKVPYSDFHLHDLVQDRHVESLVRDVNSHMRHRQEIERLKSVISKIDSYDPIVSILTKLSYEFILFFYAT